MKKYTLFIAVLLALLALAACGLDEPTPNPEPEPEPEPVEQASTTVLVYMVANNNLGSRAYDSQDLAEMEQAAREGSLGPNGRLLVYHSPYRGEITLKEITSAGTDTLRFYSADTLSVATSRLTQVIADVKAAAPAERYGLIMWSHATGWLQDGIAEPAPALRSFGSDTSRYKMNITSLASALEGQGFDFIYFDCCFMSSVETLYELRRTAPVILASPTETPVTGMPYHLTLKHLFDAEPDYDKAAAATFDHYSATYKTSDCPVSMTVVHTAGLDELARATAHIYSLSVPDSLVDYHPQRYSLRPYYYFDMYHYVDALSKTITSIGGTELSNIMVDWHKSLAKVVSYRECTPSIWGEFNVDTFCGLSTYILTSPESAQTKNYDQLQWYTDVASHLPLSQPAQ